MGAGQQRALGSAPGAWAAGGSCFPAPPGRGVGQLLGGELSSLFPQSGAVTHGAHTFHSPRPRQLWLRVKAAPGAEAAEQVLTLAPAAPPSRLPQAVGRPGGLGWAGRGVRAACLIFRHLDRTAEFFDSQCVAHLGAE